MKTYALYESQNLKDLRELIDFVKVKWCGHDLFRSPNQTDDGYTSVSFEGFAGDIESLGTALLSMDLGGKRIGVMGNNCYGWALSYFATVNSGGCVVPLDPDLAIENINYILNKTDCEALFFTSSYADNIPAVLKGCPALKHVFCMDKPFDGNNKTVFQLTAQGKLLIERGNRSFAEVKLDNNAPCAIIYTSGTTGAQKGVMLSHSNLAANVSAAVKAVHFAPGDVFLSILPYHHTYECTCGLMVVMLWGACICFNDSVKNVAKNLVRFKPTAMLLVPLYIETFYKKIMDSIKRENKEKKFKKGLRISSFFLKFGIDLRQKLFSQVLQFFGGRLKTVVCGGAYLRPDYVKMFKQLGIQILQGYGITECAPLVAVNRNKHWRFDSVGMPIPCNQVKIEGGEKVGEILIKGTNVMSGYYDDPGRTKDSFVDGWYKSGDIGYIGKSNFIYITGRKANMIVFKNGKNAAPEEFESELMKDEIIQEVVIVPRKDKDGVKDLFAYIKVDNEFASKNDSLTQHERVSKIIKDFNSTQPIYRYICDFALVKSDFPKTTSKKIIRYKVGDDSDV